MTDLNNYVGGKPVPEMRPARNLPKAKSGGNV